MAKDIYHNSVKEALVKDEWVITHDPYIIRLGGRDSVKAEFSGVYANRVEHAYF